MQNSSIKRAFSVQEADIKEAERYSMKLYRRILIVDDEPYNQLGLQIMLSQAGYPQIEKFIDFANNGHEAIEKVKEAFKSKKFSYGLIFMDFSMPIMDGFKSTEMIRSFIRQNYLMQPKVVACTGHTEDAYVLKAWKY